MEIQLFADQPLDVGPVYDSFNRRQFHYVFIAVNGLTFLNAIGLRFFSYEQLQKHCETVNEKKETGTFYPKIPITIIPVGDSGERAQRRLRMKQYIEDAFRANDQYWHCPEILFAFERNQTFNNELAVEVLREVAETIHGNNRLNNIWYIPS